MKLSNPWFLRLAAFLAYVFIHRWLSTLQYRFIHADSRKHPTDPRQGGFIYALWHENLLASARIKAKVQVLISQHRDGDIIAHASRYFRFGVVRGSTTHGGIRALRQLLAMSKTSHLYITPDGPQGPRRRVQIGIIFIASRTGLPVVPAGFGYSHVWRAPSWDQFAVPRPWSTVHIITGRPISIPPNLDRAGLEHYRQVVEQRLAALTEAADRWAQGKSSVADQPSLSHAA